MSAECSKPNAKSPCLEGVGLESVARILRILKDLPESERMDVLATVCTAFVQTNGTISSEAKRNSRETILGPLKRKRR